MLSKFDILGVHVASVNLSSAYETMHKAILSKTKGYVCVAPVSTIVDCQRVPQYKDVINAALMTTPDGMPVVWYGKSKGQIIERTYGPDLMRFTLDHGRKDGLKHFFYGSSPDVCSKLERVVQDQFPGVQIVGTYSPPYQNELVRESKEVIAQINNAQPDIVWVSLGSPKQDFWMHQHRHQINAPILVGIGAAFDFISGVKPQAPVWIQRSGFEWLFRLCCEPRRLWRRYLIGNSLFLVYIFKDLFRKTTV